VRLIIPALVEERLSDMHYITAVGDEHAETNDKSRSAEIERTICMNPLRLAV